MKLNYTSLLHFLPNPFVLTVLILPTRKSKKQHFSPASYKKIAPAVYLYLHINQHFPHTLLESHQSNRGHAPYGPNPPREPTKSLSPISSNTPCVLFNAPHLPYMSIKAFITGTHPFSQRVRGPQFHDKNHLEWHVTRVKLTRVGKTFGREVLLIEHKATKSLRKGSDGMVEERERERERDLDEQDFSREAAMTALLFWMVFESYLLLHLNAWVF
ncbi:hypothetical protein ACB098_04G142200 [Castanea mollissima]